MPRTTILPPLIRRIVALAALALLVACAATPPQPMQLYRLAAAAPVAPTPVVPATEVWQLVPPVRLPEYLDRDAILVPTGQSGLQALPGHRWAEPLRESVPRLLRQDLAMLLGESRVWGAPLPAGVVATRQLRVELLALEPTADRSAVTLQARWSLADAAGRAAPRVDAVLLVVPVAGGSVDALVAAHRLALWRLAERIAGVAAGP
ncbi:MAG: membrane integrity-associated transporter subunit PqiC [Burkholderiaceae bacterium]|nr:membrane integrity-associated transporter subunit PqiC [Burkholderiaceae bacterium]